MPTDKSQSDSETTESEGIQALRAKAEQAKELEKQLAVFQRRDQIREAGLDLESEAGKLLLDNPTLDVEAVKGLIAKAQGDQGDSETEKATTQADNTADADAAQIEAEQAKVNTGALGTTPQETNVLLSDPTAQAHTAYEAARKSGGGRGDSITAALAAIRQAAEAGNKQAVYDPRTYEGYEPGRYIRVP